MDKAALKTIIGNIYDKDIEFVNIINSLSKVNKKFYIYAGVASLILMVGVCVSTALGLLLPLPYLCIGLIILGVGIFFLISAIKIYINSDRKELTKNFINHHFSKGKLDEVYRISISEEKGKDYIKDLKFFLVNPKTTIANNSYLERDDEVNYVTFLYKDIPVNFRNKLPIRHVERHTVDGETEEHVYYENSTLLKCENNLYDNTFNGLKITRGRMFDKNYQTESVVFNKLYDINLKKGDIRAAKFLTPKLIDGFSNIKHKDFNYLIIENDFKIEHTSFRDNAPQESLGVISFDTVFSYESYKKKLANKVKEDVHNLIKAMKYIEYIY
ncbi:hypothetical protein [Spiroplasma apis]|uniref:DUF3137 domain-containing protein n=1 Tax=Spiroplasma apis B31 TaxID=1276258 RepID=V5RKM0_SPIAP|nr:hypothetical protein [Spiroplasma apis]AHB36360.1 hypothetical protein SAPIS_v1c05150 [Spiroplasma apis B31]